MSLKYMTLVDSLKEEIARRGPDGGSRLPTEAELMQMYGVSRQTVRQALYLLQQEGLIEKRQGSGSFIARSAFPAAASSHNIALLMPTTVNYATSQMIWEMQSVFSGAGYPTQAFSTENRAAQERKILQSLLGRPVRGLIAEGVRTAFPNPNHGLYEKLLADGTSIVFLHPGYPSLEQIPGVSYDDHAGGYLLAQHLLSLGHKKIAGIFRLDDLSGHRRYAGCLQALCDQGVAFDDRRFLWYDANLAELPESKLPLSFIRLYLADCTAVICQSTGIAAQLIQELQKLDIAVPQRVSVAAFGAPYPAGQAGMRITCADSPSTKPWMIAAQGLLQLIEGKAFAPVSCPWTLRRGDSTAPPEE